MIRVALAGNPNCGKTTIFNALTGLHYKVANYPGVTVEKKEGRLILPNIQEPISLIDLPGIYSLSSTSLDEKIATQCLFGELEGTATPDLVVAVLDASNLERNLYLVTQLIDCRIPLLVALNMCDLAENAGLKIYEELLSRALDVPVVALIAKQKVGLDELKTCIAQQIRLPKISSKNFAWCDAIPFLEEARNLGKAITPDEKLNARVGPLKGCSLIAESLPAPNHSILDLVKKAHRTISESELDPLTFEATKRYHWIGKVMASATKHEPRSTNSTRKVIDRILTHKIFGTAIFFVIMGVIFQSIFTWSQIPMDLIDKAVSNFGQWMAALLPDGQLKSLLVDGVIAGVGSVLIFIPQIAVLFLFLGLLEDSGYLSRAAFLMDGVMRRVGLQGRSFIPLLSSFACAIPGILSTRTIPTWADRLTTILVAPLMSCSARLPVYTVLIAAFIPNKMIWGIFSLQGLVLLSLYLLGIFGAVFAAWVMKRTMLRREPAYFVMELPPLHQPSFRHVGREVWDRVKVFCQSAGTVILACSIVLWFLASYPRTEGGGPPPLQKSYAGTIGSVFEPALRPLGYDWEIGIGLIASFAAREVFISSLATIYNVADSDEGSKSLIEKLKAKSASGEFTTATALSLMVFYVFACQCMSTLAVCRRETGSWNWVLFMFFYMGALAYLSAFITYKMALHFL